MSVLPVGDEFDQPLCQCQSLRVARLDRRCLQETPDRIGSRGAQASPFSVEPGIVGLGDTLEAIQERAALEIQGRRPILRHLARGQVLEVSDVAGQNGRGLQAILFGGNDAFRQRSQGLADCGNALAQALSGLFLEAGGPE